MVCFQPVVIQPKTAFTFDVLDHFYMDAWNLQTAVELFPKAEKVHHNAAQHPFRGLHHPSITLVSLLMGSFRTSTEAAMCVPAVAEPSRL